MKTPDQLIKRERYLRLSAVLSILIIGFVVLLAVDNMLVSFVLSFASAYFLAPFVRNLKRQGMNSDLSVAIPFFSLFIILSVAITLTLPVLLDQLKELQTNLPKYLEGLSILFEKWETKLNRSIPFNFKLDLSERLGTWSELTISKGIQYAPKLAAQLFTITLLSPLFTYFILRDGRQISRKVLSIFPNNLHEMALSLSDRINTQLGDFIRARLIEALIVGVVVWIGLTVLAFPYAIFLALFAVVMNLIPYVGPFIGAVPALLIAIINQEPSFNVLLVSLVYFIAQVIDILFVIPLVVARTVNLHPITVIVVFIIGAHLMGVLGMVISVPVASAIKLISLTVYDQLIKFRA
jgi:putative permease